MGDFSTLGSDLGNFFMYIVDIPGSSRPVRKSAFW